MKRLKTLLLAVACAVAFAGLAMASTGGDDKIRTEAKRATQGQAQVSAMTAAGSTITEAQTPKMIAGTIVIAKEKSSGMDIAQVQGTGAAIAIASAKQTIESGEGTSAATIQGMAMSQGTLSKKTGVAGASGITTATGQGVLSLADIVPGLALVSQKAGQSAAGAVIAI